MPIQAEANLSALIESTEDLIWSVDLDDCLVTFNSALKQHISSHYRNFLGHRAASRYSGGAWNSGTSHS
jgi:hypothetical protein